MEGCIVQATYDFQKEDPSDLGFITGDIIKVTKQVNDEWCFGLTCDDAGQFPSAFVKVALKDAPDQIFIAVADFKGQEEGDIECKNGDIIGLNEDVDENWIVGSSKTSHGLCPKSFLKELFFSNKGNNEVINVNTLGDVDKRDEKSCPYGESIDEFSAQTSDELSFPKGAKVELIKEIDSFWTEGIYNGTKGKFPSMFVKPVVPLPQELLFTENKTAAPDKIAEREPKAKALFFYVGSNVDELSFDKGETITLLRRIDDQWYKGQIGKSVGLFPANHVEILVDLPYESTKKNPENNTISNGNRLDTQNKEHPIIGGKLKENCENKDAFKPKPLSIKPKPSIKPKINLQKPVESSSSSKPKPTVLTSLKQQKQQQQLSSDEDKSVSEQSNKTKISVPASTKQNDSAKQLEAPIIIKAKRGKQPAPPGRPPTVNLPNGQGQLGKKQNSDLKPRPKVAAKPKSGRPLLKAPSLENDMPLFQTSKQIKRPDISQQSSAPTVSPNVMLLEQELSSLTIDENANKKPALSSLDCDASKQEDRCVNKVETKQELKRAKRPAPGRPSKEPSKTAKSANKLADSCSPIQSPKLDMKISRNSSPSALTKTVQENVTQTTRYSKRGKALPPQLPKPLAPQPPKKPPVSPRFPKYDALEVKTENQPSFQTYINPGGNLTFNGAESSNGIQERKGNEPKASTFYVDFLDLDSVDGQDQNANTEIEIVEERIVQIQGRIRSESSMLSGIETLLASSEDEDKRNELRFRHRSLSTSLIDLNEELFAYQDEKSYLLASSGDSTAIKNRIDELAQQIASYKDNCAKLHRMKNIAKNDELAEIKDGIEFCENMVETLSEEMAVLQQKLDKDEQERLREDPEEVRRKLLSQREKAVEELIKTEQDYLRDIDVCTTKILPRLSGSKAIDSGKLFGNLEEICEISKKLLGSLEKMEHTDNNSLGKQLGKCFVDVTFDLKKEYSSYCRSYDESQVLLEKLEQDSEMKDEIFNAVTASRDETGLWDLSSYLIKPVQRILKYPLILKEIHKFSPEDETDRESIKEAITALLGVATAINEFKRRKDLVQKYQRNEGIGNKIQRLNWHSVRKKSSRINQKITQFTGLVSQTVDEQFVEEEKRFRSIEKIIKNFIRSLNSYLECFQESSSLQKIVAESIRSLCEEAPIEDEVLSFYNVILKLKDVICPKFVFVVKTRVLDPLERLLQLFVSPLKLIEKRQDKCLDYDRMLNRVQKTKEADRSKQVLDELKMAKNNYIALNSQLLEELPRLSKKCLQYFHFCLSNFVKARFRYFTEISDELTVSLQLSLIERHTNADIVQKHAESLVIAAEKISQLLFYPERTTANEGMTRPEPLMLSRETFSNFYVDMLFDSSDGDATSPIKPFASKGGAIDASEPKPVPLPRRKSLRRSSSSQSSCSPTKSPVFAMDVGFSPTRRHRTSLSEDGNTELYIAEYSFEKEDSAEISIEEGTVVRVIRKHDKEANPEWWLVETSFGRGYVPSAYLSPYKGGIGSPQGEESIRKKLRSSLSQENEPVSPGVCQFEHVNNKVEIGKNEVVHSQENEKVNSNATVNGKELNGFHDRSVKVVGNPAKYFSAENHGYDEQLDGVATETQGNKAKLLYRALYDFVATEREELSIVEGDVTNVLKIGDDNGNSEWCYVECQGKLGYVPYNYLEPLNGFAP